MSTVVVALGGNALLPPAEPLSHTAQQRGAISVAAALRGLASTHQLVVTHGNGPQVGLLSLQQEAYRQSPPMPLDVLVAESEGMVGYVLEQALANALPGREVATLLTRVVVDRDDPAFTRPTKPIGPIYTEEAASVLAAEHGWDVDGEGDRWRRVVPSPEPRSIVQLATIRRLVDARVVTVCAGGGGIPVTQRPAGAMEGVEAVIDKDLVSALLAASLDAQALLLLTDVPAVMTGWGTPDAREIRKATPAQLRDLRFAAGSMGPKVDAACRFVQATGSWGAIGALDQVDAILAGEAGTRIVGGDLTPALPLEG